MDFTFESYQFATPFYALSVALRDQILRVPLGLTFTEDQLSEEFDHYHLGAFDQAGNLCACLVLIPLKDSSIKMRQVAVIEALQSQGLGTQLVKFAEEFARDSGYREVVLNARIEAVSFYKKMNYYIVGDEFVEVGIPHYRMEKNLVTI